MMVQHERLTRLCELVVQQPVIPPLSRAGGARCSVSPASRCQHGATPAQPDTSQSCVPSPWCPHLGHKLALPNSAK
ncbi:hypothetical protein L195_g007961 [Trifolium pratense]|uniref:Uncharacterized protein n=1 Tax=Trifolium pratense TaxID=57577 RepID=A0A2K3P7V3_TRIPR|nr:hypothetical protein L195_g007961 [Trifolium pratense]